MPTILLHNLNFSSKIVLEMMNDWVVGQPNHWEIQVAETVLDITVKYLLISTKNA